MLVIVIFKYYSTYGDPPSICMGRITGEETSLVEPRGIILEFF